MLPFGLVFHTYVQVKCTGRHAILALHCSSPEHHEHVFVRKGDVNGLEADYEAIETWLLPSSGLKSEASEVSFVITHDFARRTCAVGRKLLAKTIVTNAICEVFGVEVQFPFSRARSHPVIFLDVTYKDVLAFKFLTVPRRVKISELTLTAITGHLHGCDLTILLEKIGQLLFVAKKLIHVLVIHIRKNLARGKTCRHRSCAH